MDVHINTSNSWVFKPDNMPSSFSVVVRDGRFKRGIAKQLMRVYISGSIKTLKRLILTKVFINRTL